MLTGAFIAAYTLWEKHAVCGLSLSPVLYYWGSLLAQTVVLLLVALRRREEIRFAWRARRPEALGVAVLSPVAYLLVLTALVFAPVSRRWANGYCDRDGHPDDRRHLRVLPECGGDRWPVSRRAGALWRPSRGGGRDS